MLTYSLGLEAHGQNTKLIVDVQRKAIVGFCIRDLGGIKIVQHEFAQAHLEDGAMIQGSNCKLAPGSAIGASNFAEVAQTVYHSAIYGHIARLAKVLDLDGDGGKCARMCIAETIDNWLAVQCTLNAPQRYERTLRNANHLRQLWFESAYVDCKAFLRMKFMHESRKVRSAKMH